MPTDLLESNLFGHVRGAFTGAVANKKGLFEAAESGSIFFDEIGTISLETQAKLLRVIQEKEFMRVGSVETQKADVRIIAATNVTEANGRRGQVPRRPLPALRHHDPIQAATGARTFHLAEHFVKL
jgi:DNA-binding NtrC family response regulator